MSPAGALPDSTNRWRALAVLTFARTALGIQFQSVGALAPLLVERLHIQNAELGLLVGLFSLPGVVLALPGGVLGVKFGDRRVVGVGLALMAVGSSVIAVVPTFAAAVVGRILTATGAVVLNVLMTKMVADWFAGREIIWAMTIFINAWPVGIGIALFTLPPIASAWNVAAAFHGAAGVAIAGWAALVLIYPAQPPVVGASAASAAVLSRREIAAVSVAALPWMLYNTGYAVMLGFAPSLLVHSGLSIERAGVLLGAMTVLFIASVQLGGASAQWFARPEVVVALGLVPFSVALALLPYAPHVPILVAIGLFGGLPAGALVAAPSTVLRPQSRATGMGVFYTWYYAGMSALPPIAGWLQDQIGRATAIHFGAAALLVTLACYLAFRACFAAARGAAEEMGRA